MSVPWPGVPTSKNNLGSRGRSRLPVGKMEERGRFSPGPGGTASPAHRCGRETSGSETPQGRPLQREAPSGSQLSFFYMQSLECLSLKQTACQSL